MAKNGEEMGSYTVFEALSDPQRVAILEALQKKVEMSFTELMKKVDVASGRLAFQLSKLSSMLEKTGEKYKLSSLGHSVLEVFNMTETLLDEHEYGKPVTPQKADLDDAQSSVYKRTKYINVRPLREDEKKRFFEFAVDLPDRDLWGRKGFFLRGDFERFNNDFFEYIAPFHPKSFLIAEEDNKFVGFVVAIYNSAWINELKERYGHDIDKRVHILGIAVTQRRRDVLKALTNELANCLSKEGIEGAEYPTFGGVCLTTGSDVLTPENIDALIMFREAGFRISECYYFMKLDLGTKCQKEYPIQKGTFRLNGRSIELFDGNEILGRVTWEPVENGKTDLDVYVAPNHRGKGFGTALMAKAMNQVKNEGAKTLDLGVDGNNLPALKLYRKFGSEVYKTHFYIIVPFKTLIHQS